MKVHCICGREFAAEFTPTNHYSARCPSCGALTARNVSQQTASTAMPHQPKSEAECIAGRVSRISILCNILWLIVGAGQIISVCSTWMVVGFGPRTALEGTADIGVVLILVEWYNRRYALSHRSVLFTCYKQHPSA